MAKKRRTPPPPRVQAPQRRDTKAARDRRTRWLVLAAAGGAAAAVAIVLAVVALGGGDGGATVGGGKQQPLARGCTLKKYPLLEGTHVTTDNAKVKWNSWPPTSGAHYFQPAPWNFYEEPVNPRITLHNLEHGGIVIFYGSGVPQAEIEKLRTFWQDDPNAMLVAPMPHLDKNITVPRPAPNYRNKIVATAWTSTPYSNTTERTGQEGNGWLLSCSRFDEQTFAKFRDVHRGNGPERIPVSLSTPGS